jgi:DnaJ like chaperone protein
MKKSLHHWLRALPEWLERRSRRAMPYTEFTFAALGRIAKGSDVVRPAHVDQARRLMNDLGFAIADRRRAVAWFDAGKNPDFDFTPFAHACLDVRDDRDVLNALAIESMCLMAWADGPPTVARRGEYERLAAMLGATRDVVADIEARVADHRRRELPADLRSAYALLEVEHWVDDDALKLAYRRRMSRHHPDKLGASTDAALAHRARENSIATRAAYDLICERRNGASTNR